MTRYRQVLPQLSSPLFLTDGGLETDLIFNHRIEIPEFAAHTLLETPAGRVALENYYQEFLALAEEKNRGFILDTPTWKAHRLWVSDLGCHVRDLQAINHNAVRFMAQIRDNFLLRNRQTVVLNGVVGPCGDAYRPESRLSSEMAEEYHLEQLTWLSETDVDMVTAMTFTQSEEAIGFVRAAQKRHLPSVVSFTVETNGVLPTGESLQQAIESVDAQTQQGPAYFMINCAHPTHFSSVLKDQKWLRRIGGLRCNASQLSHDKLDQARELDAGDPEELAQQNMDLLERMPWMHVLGGCCGSNLAHVVAIADRLPLAKKS